MNGWMIVYTVGMMLKVEAALMCLPLGVCLYYGESPWAFLVTIFMLLTCGWMMSIRRPQDDTIYAREGFFIVGLSWLLLALDQQDHVSNFTAVAACVNNIGPALGACGPMGSYAPFNAMSKLILSFDMLAGRLEIFLMLMLFAPSSYRRK